jgi:hypothetical protein
MPIYSRGNNKEYLAHIAAVLQLIKEKGLPKKCQVLTKAVVKRSEALKNLQEAAGSRDTISRCGASLGGTLCDIINLILRLFLYHFVHTLSL